MKAKQAAKQATNQTNVSAIVLKKLITLVQSLSDVK